MMLSLRLKMETRMPTIHIQGEDLPYEATDIITFDEGLIGFPELKRLVLIRQSSIEPFFWLASVDDPDVVFLVVDPRPFFPHYKMELLDAGHIHRAAVADEKLLVLAISVIAPEWKESKINLRAPLFISPSTMRGIQFVLSDSPYRSDEQFPQQAIAA